LIGQLTPKQPLPGQLASRRDLFFREKKFGAEFDRSQEPRQCQFWNTGGGLRGKVPEKAGHEKMGGHRLRQIAT
jgi:hypothetical protein